MYRAIETRHNMSCTRGTRKATFGRSGREPALHMFAKVLLIFEAVKVQVAALMSLDTRPTEFFGNKNEHPSGGMIWRMPSALEANLDKVERVNVYVYDDPVFDHRDLIPCYNNAFGVPPWLDEREDSAQDMAEVWLHQTMLDHPWRVLDPDMADIFFVPLYPVLSFKLLKWKWYECGRSHEERLKNAIHFLETKSIHFKKFGGADHVVVCTWWNCRRALDPWTRMSLRRAVIGINELLVNWARWGCGGRSITVPYTANSAITSGESFGGLDLEVRDIPFFFAGSARNRPERRNLEIVKKLYPDSIIELGENPSKWNMNATGYAAHISRARFCFCPRGDSRTSRRIFDAAAAGCIPVLTEEEAKATPFVNFGLDYTKFSVVVPAGGFHSYGNVAALVKGLVSMPKKQLKVLHEGVRMVGKSIVYGVNTGTRLEDMHPFPGTGAWFLRSAKMHGGGENIWSCQPVPFDDEHLSPRTDYSFPPKREAWSEWLSKSETIVNKERSLLFCAPPNTGSLQFRMLAKRMKGVRHWSVFDHYQLLFDPIASELPLLNFTNAQMMTEIYRDKNSSWIKIGVVRDPITRLVSAYLDFVHASRQREGINRNELKWFADTHDGNERNGESTDGAIIPTFTEVIDALEKDIRSAPLAFRPISSLCGIQHSPFETIIPFEALQKTSIEVLKSLPGGVWDTYGASGWGPDGDQTFMNFDYGGVLRDGQQSSNETTSNGSRMDGQCQRDIACPPQTLPRRARDLFRNGSCAWTTYYTDVKSLERAKMLYSEDYRIFGWYSVKNWISRFEGCAKTNL